MASAQQRSKAHVVAHSTAAPALNVAMESVSKVRPAPVQQTVTLEEAVVVPVAVMASVICLRRSSAPKIAAETVSATLERTSSAPRIVALAAVEAAAVCAMASATPYSTPCYAPRIAKKVNVEMGSAKPLKTT